MHCERGFKIELRETIAETMKEDEINIFDFGMIITGIIDAFFMAL